MVKKLYIPTSTLNFNNILSSESISPKAFYERRGFGYKRWVSVKENDNVNCTLLYENFCSFVIPPSDQEDHPMIVEIEAEETDFQKYADGVWYADKTIYLNPWHSRFVFFSLDEKRIAFSMSDNSLETKLVKLYTKYSSVEKPQTTYVVPIKKDVPLNELEIDNDIRLNKMKGLLYGYYIGALLSASSDYIAYITNLKEIRNIFSAIISNPNHTITNIQSERIDFLFDQIKAFEPVVLQRKKEEETLYKLLKDLAPDKDMANFQQVFAFFFNGKEVALPYDKGQLVMGLKMNFENNPSLNWIDRKISELESHKSKCYLTPMAQEIKVDHHEVIDIKAIENEDDIILFKEWCNRIFSSTKYNGYISIFNAELATAITIMAKSTYGDKWDDNNPVKGFLNKLRRHIAGEGFDVKWDNNGLLYSVAAVLTNGEDWNKLLNFMQSKGMSDYRLAFAIFGELNGFANLPRDFTDILFDCEKEYISSVYREFFKQLFGKELNGQLELPKLQQNVQQQTIITPAIETKLAKRVDNIIAAHPKVQISSTERQAIDNAKCKDLSGEEFIKLIDNDMDSLTKGIFPYLQKEFYPGYKKPQKTAQKIQNTNGKGQGSLDKEKDLFSANPDNSIKLKFSYAEIENIALAIQKRFNLDSDVMTTLKSDLQWVLNPEYNSSKSETELINNFQIQLEKGRSITQSSKGKPMEWKNRQYARLDIPAIILFLKEIII